MFEVYDNNNNNNNNSDYMHLLTILTMKIIFYLHFIDFEFHFNK